MGKIPRKRKKKTEIQSVSKSKPGNLGEVVGKPKKKKKKRRKKEINIDALADKMIKEVSEFLGLDTLALPNSLLRDIVREVMHVVITSTSYKPSTDVILKRISRHSEIVNMIIASKMLEKLKDFTDEQLEFIVYNGKRALIPEISRLYRILEKKGRRDLLSYLQYVWEKYGRPTPVRCPKCGFRSIMPDYSCYMCGYVVSEKYLREQLDFDSRFREYVKEASENELEEVLDVGFVLVSENEIESPKKRPELGIKHYYIIYLGASDISLIKDELAKRKEMRKVGDRL